MGNDATTDPQHSTFAQRLRLFKRKKNKYCSGENDEQFCERLGISISRFRSWLYKNTEPDIKSLLHLSQLLDVEAGWLYCGEGETIEHLPEDNMRIIRIPREPLEIYEDLPKNNNGDDKS